MAEHQRPATASELFIEVFEHYEAQGIPTEEVNLEAVNEYALERYGMQPSDIAALSDIEALVGTTREQFMSEFQFAVFVWLRRQSGEQLPLGVDDPQEAARIESLIAQFQRNGGPEGWTVDDDELFSGE